MYVLLILFSLLICGDALSAQNVRKPLTLTEICKTYSPSVVEVNTDVGRGTGFVVDPNGWILTAFHVVADRTTLGRYGNIRVTIAGRRAAIPAETVSPLDKLASARDFVILKAEATQLQSLKLGAENEAEAGSPVSIIGFPYSAMLPVSGPVPKFCLTGTIAAQSSLLLGNLEFLHTVYFQGVSIKGISGAPVISNETGKVVGIVSTKLTGISPALDKIKGGPGGDFAINGMPVGGSIADIVNVLDNQLANGLGSATGASDAALALTSAKRNYKKRSKQN